jgi:hypothetical protein
MLLGYPSGTSRDFFIPQTKNIDSGEYNFYLRDEW